MKGPTAGCRRASQKRLHRFVKQDRFYPEPMKRNGDLVILKKTIAGSLDLCEK